MDKIFRWFKLRKLVAVLVLVFCFPICALSAQSSVTRTLTLPKTQGYTLTLTLGPGDAIKGEIWNDDIRAGKFTAPEGARDRVVRVEGVLLDEGEVTLEFRTKTGELPLKDVAFRDALRVHTDPIRSVPMDPAATAKARRLLAFLAGQSGKHILSGQQDLTWNDSIDMNARVLELTGKEPAVVGFDMINYLSEPGTSGQQQTEEAIAWSRRGGIVAFCWHWRVGSEREFYTNQTGFRIPKATDTKSWAAIDADLDVIAEQLSRLQDAGVPVLWRPLHEASGGWFWWGASGGEAFKTLWNHVYNRLVKVHKLHNLLWVWNGQNPDWYPGDETVDVVGWDIYGNERQYLAFPDTWLLAQSIPVADSKLVTLSENGPIPDPDLLVSQKVPWSWFVTWNDGDKGKPEDDFWSGTKYMDDDFKKRVYNHPYVVTLDELPALGWRP